HVYRQVQQLPEASQLAQPEIVARGGHKKQAAQRYEAEGLEGQIGQVRQILGHRKIRSIRGQCAQYRIHYAKAVELKDSEDRMNQSQKEHGDAEMPPVVEQRK